MKLNKQELWEERIIAFESSGLSRRAWNKEQGFDHHVLVEAIQALTAIF